MVKLFSQIRENGVYQDTLLEETKKIRLLNVFCLCWFCFSCVFITVDSLFMPNPFYNILTHLSCFFILLVVFFLQNKRQYFVARLVYIFSNASMFLLFANVLEPNSMMEYFLLITPMLGVLFIDNKLVNWIILIFSYLSFLLPIKLLNHYSTFDINPISNFILFFAIFISVNYFKDLNHKKEKLLEQQKNEALLDKQKIEFQGKEIAELYAFQNHFMVNLSHEIRTPLTLIKGSSSQLRSQQDRQKINEINDSIDTNTDKIKHLVDNIIDVAKMNSKKLELNRKLFHVLPFAQKISSSFDSIFKNKNIDFQIINQVDNPNILINADKTYLERAVGNLILNAYNYCPCEGSVCIKYYLQKDQFVFEIKDSGCGISEEEQELIFKPFYRAKNSINQAGGSGIGLSFAKEVIALHDGKIELESHLDLGAKFKILLPFLESEKALKEFVFVQNNELEKHKGAAILLVEDNQEMQDYLRIVLSDFDLTVANNGLDALNKLEVSVPKLIITDYMMPEMNGYDFASNIKNKGIDCPIIVLTARMDEAGKLDFLRLGIDDYLTKPFNEEELLIRIGHSLNNYKHRKRTDGEEMVSDDFVAKVQREVLKNLNTFDYAVIDLAEALSLTERTLNRKLKISTGLTPNGFIREIKLLESKRVLESNPKVSLKEITLNMGFKNSTHFSTLYETRFGKKPIG